MWHIYLRPVTYTCKIKEIYEEIFSILCGNIETFTLNMILLSMEVQVKGHLKIGHNL